MSALPADRTARLRWRQSQNRRRLIDFGAVYDAAAGRCGICGESVAIANAHMDHVVPLSAGGADDESNVQPAHARCNALKGRGTTEHARARIAATTVLTGDGPVSQAGAKWTAQSIRDLRQRLGSNRDAMPQDEFGRLLGVTAWTVSKWETHHQAPRSRSILRELDRLAATVEASR